MPQSFLTAITHRSLTVLRLLVDVSRCRCWLWMRCTWTCLRWIKTCTGTTVTLVHPTPWLLLTTASPPSSAPPVTWGHYTHSSTRLFLPPTLSALGLYYASNIYNFSQSNLAKWTSISFRLSDILQLEEADIHDSCPQQDQSTLGQRQESVKAELVVPCEVNFVP